MKRIILGVVGVGMLAASAAWAGYKSPGWSVTVDTVNRSAGGSMQTARSSADANQFLQCVVSSYSTGTPSGWCEARDASSNYGFCFFSAPALITAAQTLTTDAYMYITWDANGNCLEILQQNSSYLSPKTP